MIAINHCKKLVDRKKHMVEQMKNAGLKNYFFNDVLDADEIEAFINDWYECDIKRAFEKSKATSQVPPPWIKKSLKTTEISLIEKNIVALSEFIDSDDEYLLVLEDDIKFIKSFDLDQIASNAPDKWSAIFLGGFCEKIEHTTVVKSFGEYHLVSHPATNGACAVMYSRSGAKIVLDSLYGKRCGAYHLPFDWELNYIFKTNNCDVYHYEYICIQLSRTVFETSLI